MEEKMDQHRRFLWAYGMAAFSPPQRRSFAERVLKEYGVTDLFLSMSGILSPDKLNESALAAVINDLRPLRIHSMVFEDSFYLDFSTRIEERIRSLVNTLNSYNLSHWDSRISGIHLDVEPHARPEFKAGSSNPDEDTVHSLFSRYVGLLKCFRANLDLSLGLCEQDFLFSAATGWWYESRDDATLAILCRYLDSIVPMAYNSREEPVGGSLERMKGKLPYDRWNSTAPTGTGFVVGLGFCEYDSICEVADPLQHLLLKAYPNVFRGLAFFSSFDILTDVERCTIHK